MIRASSVSAMPRLSQMRATGISRICGGSRLPASITSSTARRPGMLCLLSANAAQDASSSENTTVKPVTTTLLISACPPPSPSRKTVTKPSRVTDCGSDPSPLEVRSANVRKATSTTNASGRIQRIAIGVMTTWKIQCLRRRRTGGVDAEGAGPTGAATVVALISVLLPRGAHQVSDDEEDGQQEDHDGDRRAVSEIHHAEARLVHVRRQQLRRVVGATAGHR